MAITAWIRTGLSGAKYALWLGIAGAPLVPRLVQEAPRPADPAPTQPAPADQAPLQPAPADPATGSQPQTAPATPTLPPGDRAAEHRTGPRRADLERELKKLRFEYFRKARNPETRQVGIDRMRTYTDPAVFDLLVEVFGDEGPDAQQALVEHLAAQGSAEGFASLAWVAIFHASEPLRARAAETLAGSLPADRPVPDRVRWAVAAGLSRRSETELAAAAGLAQSLRLFEAIPMLINAQVRAAAVNTATEPQGAIAWILVGQQQTFVSDLNPVVGESAVAFDPVLSVLTTGTVVRVINAVVVSYNVDVHRSLVRLADAGWDGRTTAGLGWDGAAWSKWYREEFLPYRAALAAKAEPGAP